MVQEETSKYIQERVKKPKCIPSKGWMVLPRRFPVQQGDTDISKSEDSFYLQMQIKKPQADQESCETQHLVTNLQCKVKPHGKRTKFLRARIDTCSNASIYKIQYYDPDCTKLLPSKKNGINNYTKHSVPVNGSCELFVLHQDDQCFHKVKFQVVSVEGSVIISCATSINLNLIQIPDQLDTKIPDCTGLVYNSANAPYKHQYKEKQNAKKPVFSGKKSQETHKWPQKPCQETHMQPQKSIQQCYRRLCKDKTCQSTRCFKINSDPKRQKMQYNWSNEPRRDKYEGDQSQKLSTRH